MTRQPDRHVAEKRFRTVFAHLGAVTAYARRRGSRDAEGIAAEVMTIAWRRLADVPADDPRPWLFGTARNLVLAERRKRSRPEHLSVEQSAPPSEPFDLDPELGDAIQSLSRLDREALLLVAWEDLTPSQAARSLGINPAAFRVRLLRARRRLQRKLDAAQPSGPSGSVTHLEMEQT